ncbi:MAG TPA: hypothetical protein VFQ43_19365 [Nitrososphaera sp.]|nr:hypothetical protein [Nitrososphaera sp.]
MKSREIQRVIYPSLEYSTNSDLLGRPRAGVIIYYQNICTRSLVGFLTMVQELSVNRPKL